MFYSPIQNAQEKFFILCILLEYQIMAFILYVSSCTMSSDQPMNSGYTGGTIAPVSYTHLYYPAL